MGIAVSKNIMFLPLFCPKCKQETIINVKQRNIIVSKGPDVKRKSR
ncbi:cysteine-rich KTR domain-containing protein [Anaerocolumna jejuensis]